MSKRQACIELTQQVKAEGGEAEHSAELVSCLIWDLDSLNKTKLNQNIILKPNEKYPLKINDSIEFGSLKFKLSPVSRRRCRRRRSL